jgi:hypothetical protein
MTAHNGPVHDRVHFIVANVAVAHVITEQMDNILIIVDGGQMQACVPIDVSQLQVCIGFNQQINAVQITVVYAVENSAAVVYVNDVDVLL